MQPELHITELTQKMQWCHYPDRNDWIGHLPGYFRKRLYKRLRPGDNPYFRTLPPLEKGSNWIVVTDRFRDFVFDYLRTHPDYIRAFRHSHCGDEIFFQTLMGISEFAGANTRRPLVFTRWVGEGAPHPETFGTNDLPRLLQARDTAAEVPYLFARKIADDDLDIARYRAAFFPRPE
ncbi:MAG: beta-1,6-N-acetylglucosaminyltransferase [Alistipes onderdonkii]